MRLLKRLLLWVLLVLVVVLALGAGGGYFWLRRSLPQTSGEIRVSGISGPVTIVRDSDGVAHITAATETDAAFGLGFVHAQERLWQMEVQRRIGHGRLSEIFGATTLDTDRFLRTLGVARAARSAYERLDAETIATLEAYAAGVNAFVSTTPVLPPEFLVLGVQPEPWQPIDSLVWAKMMAWDLGGNWNDEVMRSLLIAQIGSEDADFLMPAYTTDGPLILPEGALVQSAAPASAPAAAIQSATAQAMLELWETVHLTTGLGDRLAGSNNWVIGGARTASGKPLLVNDPHLGNRIPSIWYLAHMQGGAINSIGATFPGLPAVVIGHNERIAWGVTNTGPDVQDLYIERIDAQNYVEYNGRREPVMLITETINVKDAVPVTLTVRITRHGPIISDVTSGTGETLAFRWTSLDEEDATIRVFLNINRARNWEEFTAALRDYKAPMQNFVYADVDGNIGYYAPGTLPIRRNGDGTLPVPGWTDEYEWVGYAPFELPHVYNPPQGYIVTANNRVTGDEYPYLLGTSWAAPYRAQRIIEMIEQGNRLTVADMRTMLGDVVSVQARELLPALLAVQPARPREAAALELLRGWDGAIRGDSAAAAVYQGYYYAAIETIFADELRDLFERQYQSERDFPAMALRAVLLDGRGEWCDDVTTLAVTEDCATTLAKALTRGGEAMAKAQGESDPARWRWDRVHQAVFPHTPFSQVGALRGMFERRIQNGGDNFTVNVAPVRITEPYLQYNAPSYRQIIDLGDLNASRFMHTTGQSGNVLSSRYSDYLERWQRVEDIPMRFSGAIEGERLVLAGE